MGGHSQPLILPAWSVVSYACSQTYLPFLHIHTHPLLHIRINAAWPNYFSYPGWICKSLWQLYTCLAPKCSKLFGFFFWCIKSWIIHLFVGTTLHVAHSNLTLYFVLFFLVVCFFPDRTKLQFLWHPSGGQQQARPGVFLFICFNFSLYDLQPTLVYNNLTQLLCNMDTGQPRSKTHSSSGIQVTFSMANESKNEELNYFSAFACQICVCE